MASPISVLCLLMMAGTLLGLDPKQARYRQEGGKFNNTPEATLSAPSTISCAISCAAMEPWFCGGFTYHDGGSCDLYRGNEEVTCINPEQAAPGLEEDSGSEPRSYRRLQSACPGTKSEPCGCPAGFSRCAGRCLKLQPAKAPHAEAASACAELGGHLVVPRSEAENRCALDMAQGTSHVFIGATDVVTEETFIGVDGTCGPVPASTEWWRFNEPNNENNNEHCAMFFEGTWGDIPCSFSLASLCQLASCYQPQCQ